MHIAYIDSIYISNVFFILRFEKNCDRIHERERERKKDKEQYRETEKKIDREIE